MRDALLIASGFVGFFALVVAAAVGIDSRVSYWRCEGKTAGLALPHRWSYQGDCQVKDPRVGWVPLANYRVF